MHDNDSRSKQPPHMSFAECCDSIIRNAHEPALNWAVNYAKAGRNMVGEEARVQALYIVGNISRWRGEEARNVRHALKRISKRRA